MIWKISQATIKMAGKRKWPEKVFTTPQKKGNAGHSGVSL